MATVDRVAFFQEAAEAAEAASDPLSLEKTQDLIRKSASTSSIREFDTNRVQLSHS